jgi:isopentenyldiphosphate isomerase
MELIDVYDSDRRLTGKVVERGKNGPGEYRLIAHVCVFDEEWRMLIQKRAPSKRSFPGYWDISAGGQVDTGEESPEGISRELFEELGIRRKLTYDDRVCTVSFLYGFDDYFITGYSKADSLVLRGQEVSEVSWATLDEILGLIEDRTFIQYRPSFIRALFDCYYRFSGMEDVDNDKAFYPYERYKKG